MPQPSRFEQTEPATLIPYAVSNYTTTPSTDIVVLSKSSQFNKAPRICAPYILCGGFMMKKSIFILLGDCA
jgi:hypothetical protein